jgi:hypothetical protein
LRAEHLKDLLAALEDKGRESPKVQMVYYIHTDLRHEGLDEDKGALKDVMDSSNRQVVVARDDPLGILAENHSQVHTVLILIISLCATGKTKESLRLGLLAALPCSSSSLI